VKAFVDLLLVVVPTNVVCGTFSDRHAVLIAGAFGGIETILLGIDVAVCWQACVEVDSAELGLVFSLSSCLILDSAGRVNFGTRLYGNSGSNVQVRATSVRGTVSKLAADPPPCPSGIASFRLTAFIGFALVEGPACALLKIRAG
jgi:hypothetical protein